MEIRPTDAFPQYVLDEYYGRDPTENPRYDYRGHRLRQVEQGVDDEGGGDRSVSGDRSCNRGSS